METFFLLLLPILQLGVSGYIAVSSLSVIVMLIRFREQLKVGAVYAAPAAAIILLVIPSLFAGYGIDPMQNFLRAAREAVIAVLLVWVAYGAGLAPAWSNARRFLRVSLALTTGWLLLIIVQFFALRGGVYIGFPIDYFNNQTALVPDELTLRFQIPRPQATFSEPSYFGFIALSLMLIASQVKQHAQLRMGIFATAAIGGLACQAASFFIFGSLLFLVSVLDRRAGSGKYLLILLLPLSVLLLLQFGSEWSPFERVVSGNLTSDHSFFVRLFGPLQVVSEYLLEYPFGLPGPEVADALYPFVAFTGIAPEAFLSNSITNLFFQYGVAGLPILAALLWAPRTNLLRLYLVAAMMQNGGILGIDKLAVVGFTFCMFHAFRAGHLEAAKAARPDLGQSRLPAFVERAPAVSARRS